MFAGHGFASKIANYREPGHSGYVVDDVTNLTLDESMQKYYQGCLNSTSGDIEECTMSVGGSYTKCVNGCEVIKCADEESQLDCESISNITERQDCESKIKYCINYEINAATMKHDGDTSHEEHTALTVSVFLRRLLV